MSYDVAPSLLGSQTPRILWAPEAASSGAAEAIELAADCGLILDPWQQLVLRHALGERGDGSWSAFEVGLCVPRQNGKSAIIEARILAGLLLFDEQLITYSAHEFRTALEIMRRLERLLIASGEKYLPSTSHGQEGFELGAVRRQGRRVLFQSRTKAAGLGTSGDCIILDEAMWLSPEAIGVLMPTMAARPNPQLWYAGSSVDQEMHPRGHVFSGVRKRGIEGTSPRLLYIEWSPPDTADRADPQVWLGSNPAAGLRPGFGVEYIRDEFDAMRHTPKMFDVMRLGRGDWPTLEDQAKPPVSEESWSRLCDTSPDLAVAAPAVIAVDRGPASKTWVITGAQRAAGTTIHVEVGFCQNASATDVVEKLVAVVTDADPSMLVIDQKSPAAILRPYLVEAGIEPHMTNTGEYIVAWQGWLEAIDQQQVSHSGQSYLTQSVLGTLAKEMHDGRTLPIGAPGVWVGPNVAAMLAHWGVLNSAPPRPAAPAPIQDSEPAPQGVGVEIDVMNAPF